MSCERARRAPTWVPSFVGPAVSLVNVSVVAFGTSLRQTLLSPNLLMARRNYPASRPKVYVVFRPTHIRKHGYSVV